MTLCAPPRGRGRTRWARAVALLAALLLLTACGVNANPSLDGAAPAGAAPQPGRSGAAAVPTRYDIAPLLDPKHKYFGAALPNVPTSLSALGPFTKAVGKQPNLLEFYTSWGASFDAAGARQIYQDGALPYMAWEPYTPSLADIAKGDTDSYIRQVAAQVAALNLPVAISFGHEMNGNWYAWGYQSNTAADFVNAWRHIHDLFQEAGADNVIWVWSPNIINPDPSIQLAPYYPGNSYVDWIGMVGYYTLTGAKTFPTLYGPTMDEVDRFADKPFLISETSSQPGNRRFADVDNLFSGVETHRNVVGFVWFDIPKRADWRIENTPVPLAEYRKRASNPIFGFDLRSP
ncbi:beta-mannanase [Streptacidiphilus sp. 4-A2]|nr:beta-mannanase [Streptacidiphilus sp. 4-A2]